MPVKKAGTAGIGASKLALGVFYENSLNRSKFVVHRKPLAKKTAARKN